TDPFEAGADQRAADAAPLPIGSDRDRAEALPSGPPAVERDRRKGDLAEDRALPLGDQRQRGAAAAAQLGHDRGLRPAAVGPAAEGLVDQRVDDRRIRRPLLTN